MKVSIFRPLLLFNVGAILAANAGPTNDLSSALTLARQLNEAFVQVADQVSPAVVVISVAHRPDRIDLDEVHPFLELLPDELRERFRKQQEERRRKQPKRAPADGDPVFDGQGSGLVIREEGFILTNGHVIEDADKIKVRLRDGSEHEAQVRGVDAQSDIAVLKIDARRPLAAARLGDSSKIRVGEFAIAIGAPLELDYSVTFGHISAKGRSHIVPDPSMDQDFIQTDANINPGNSGGPLVNIDGEVVGINTLIRGLRTGIGFAVPINLAREVADKLITEGRYTRAWLGVAIGALKDETELRGTLKNVSDGVVVKQVMPDGPAAKAALKAGDVITTVDGRPVGTAQQLKNEIRAKTIGKSVTLEVHRQGMHLRVPIVPEAWPEPPKTTLAKNTRSPSARDTAEGLGLTVQTLTPELAEQFGVDKTQGVIVTEVAEGSDAEQKGLRTGDVVTELNHKPVTNARQFEELLRAVDPKKGVILNYTSRGLSKFEVLKETEPAADPRR